MKAFYILLISILVLSCSSQKSTKSSTKKSVAYADCTESIEEYVRNNQGLITNSTENYSVNKIIKQSDDTYKVQLRWVTG